MSNNVEVKSEDPNSNLEIADKKGPSYINWFFGVLFLAFVTLLSGTPNLFPSQRLDIIAHFGFTDGQATFFLTAGTFLLFLSLPSGFFLDHFGSTLTYFISVILTVVSYIVLCILFFVKISHAAIIIFYLLMAFGSSSLFATALQIVISHSPPKFFGLSMAVISASMSFSYGFCSIIYKYFAKIFGCQAGSCNAGQSMAAVGIFVCIMYAVFGPIAFYFFHKFAPPKSNEPKVKLTREEKREAAKESAKKTAAFLWLFIKDKNFYILMVLMFLGVFIGQMIISAGQPIWVYYGDPLGAFDFSLLFSILNAVFTICLSAILDYLIAHKGWTREKGYAVFSGVFTIIPIFDLIVFLVSHNKTLFGVATSCMGIPFGFALTHLPALTGIIFGAERFGVAFGVIQIGSLIAAAIALPMMTAMSKIAIAILFAVVAGLYLFLAFITYFFLKSNVSNSKMEASDEEDLPEAL